MSERKIVKAKYVAEGEAIETLAEVSTDKKETWRPGKRLEVVGKAVPRVDGYDKVSGTALYTFDVVLANMAHARTLRSPYPHARIQAIDIEKALKLPGVLDIITYKNTAPILWYDNTSFLFDPHLRYLGDEVACVAAESEEIAAAALDLIEVKYNVMPFVVDDKEAMKADAPKLYDDGNIRRGRADVYARGDIDKGFSEADVVVEDTFFTQVAIHNPTEAHCSVANWDGDRLTVWDSTQYIFRVRDTLAESLKMPASKVRVIKKYMGGGFGTKLIPGKYTVMAALLARRIGRPVKIVLDRRELNLAVGNRPNSMQELKLAAKKDGTLTALSHHSRGAIGAYPSGAGCSVPLRTLYRCPNVKTEEYSVFINAGSSRPMRAPGHVQGTFALESIMDEAAEKLGMDPIGFRLKNHTEIDQTSGLPYTSKRLQEAYKAGAEAIGWQRRNRPAGSGGTGSQKRGIGMASQIWWGGGGPPAYATIKLNRDGSAHVLSGTQDIGTGTYTFMAQVAAEVLEIPLEKISVTLGDTGVCPYAPLSGGSMTAPSVAPAVHDAAVQMKAKLISAASAQLELPRNQLRYKDGVVTAKADESKRLTITDIIRRMRERVLITTGARNANPAGYAVNTFGAQFAEVEVDCETGKVRVLKVAAAHDVGRVLNRRTLENQCHGGIIQGVSFALMEQRIMDKATGKVLNTNLHDYKIPTIRDVPEIDVHIVSTADNRISRVGSKGVGEPAHIPTAAAIANAVYNAIGVRIKTLPITPDRVLAALQKERSGT